MDIFVILNVLKVAALGILTALTIENMAAFCGVPQPVMVGTLVGTFVGAVARGSHVSKSSIWVRLANIISGFYFALYGTEGFVQILYHYMSIEPDVTSHRLGGLVLGIGGSFVVDMFFNFWARMGDEGGTFAKILVSAARDSLRTASLSIGNRDRDETVDQPDDGSAPAVDPADAEEVAHVCP